MPSVKEKKSRKSAPVVVIGEKPVPLKPRPVKVSISGRQEDGARRSVILRVWGSSLDTVEARIADELRALADERTQE